MLTAKQLAEWADFHGREPWGFHVQDAWHGISTATTAAAAGAQNISARDFMLSTSLEAAEAERAAGVPDEVSPIARQLMKLIPPAPAPAEPDSSTLRGTTEEHGEARIAGGRPPGQ